MNLAVQLTYPDKEFENLRKNYNDVVKKLNIQLDIFHNNFFAKIFKLEKEKEI